MSGCTTAALLDRARKNIEFLPTALIGDILLQGTLVLRALVKRERAPKTLIGWRKREHTNMIRIPQERRKREDKIRKKRAKRKRKTKKVFLIKIFWF
jgi:Zn-finger nucleic acid-binding protein